MKNTKQRILDTSRMLFNNLGYSRVTIRMIASELNMSSGNLNYHFRKREDILEALYFEMVEVFDKRVQMLGDQKISLKFMQSNIQSSMKRMIEYRFFWTDLYYIIKSNKNIKTHFEEAKRERSKGYQMVFNYLIHQKVMKTSSFSDEYRLLIERMIGYSNTWLYSSILYENNENYNEILKDASFHLLSMIYPYLTMSGQKDFQSIHPYFFVNKL